MPRAKCAFYIFFNFQFVFFSEKYETKKVLKITFTKLCKTQTQKTGFPQ